MTPEREAELQKEFDEWLATPAGRAFHKRLENLTWPKWLPRLADGRINWQALEREAARRGIIGAAFWESTPAEIQLAIEGADWRDQRNMNLLADALRRPSPQAREEPPSQPGAVGAGRPWLPENEWAWREVNEHGREKREVYAQWLTMRGEGVKLLAEPWDSFKKVVSPKRKPP